MTFKSGPIPAGETNTTIQARRGLKAELPTEAAQGEFLYCLDTHEMFMGMGAGFVPVLVKAQAEGSTDADSIAGVPVDPTPPTDGEILIYDNASGQYVAADPVVSGPDAPNAAPTRPPVQIGAIGDDGTVKRIAATDAGELKISLVGGGGIVDVSGSTVSIDNFPADASTATNQEDGNTSLASIDTKTPALSGGKVPVTDPTALPLPAGAATSALQTTGNTSLASIDTKTPALSSGKVPVTDPTALPLPAGAATSALQTTGNTSLASIDTKTPTVGQKNMAGSSPVTLASDQPTIPNSAETGTVFNGITALTPKFKLIAASTSGVNAVVAAVAAKKIRVLKWDLVANGAVNVKWQSHVTPTDLTGLYYLAQNGGLESGFCPVGHFETVAGEALDLNLSGNIAVGGVLTYIEV